MTKLKAPKSQKFHLASNTIMLLITIVLFIALYGAGCVMYASKDFGRLQNFFNVLINMQISRCQTHCQSIENNETVTTNRRTDL